MKEKNIVFIGIMGSGKSMTARKLAQLLNKRMISTDEMIEKKEAKTISDIFRDKGESYFRQLERQMIKEIASESNVIIDCGGGIVLNQENIDDLKKNGILINLVSAPEKIFERMKKLKNRPLLNHPDPLSKIKELIKTRAPYYRQADFEINTDDRTAEDICREVIELIRHE